MEYEWQAIDKPPDDDRDVLLWLDIDQGYFVTGGYELEEKKWYTSNGDMINSYDLTHWKDIKQP